jgi:hypothetical protein
MIQNLLNLYKLVLKCATIRIHTAIAQVLLLTTNSISSAVNEATLKPIDSELS